MARGTLMGNSGGRKKKGGVADRVQGDSNSISKPDGGGVDLDSVVFLKRAHELKEEGNGRFQSKDYASAFEQYDKALQLMPWMSTHPRQAALFHSHRSCRGRDSDRRATSVAFAGKGEISPKKQPNKLM